MDNKKKDNRIVYSHEDATDDNMTVNEPTFEYAEYDARYSNMGTTETKPINIEDMIGSKQEDDKD